MCPRKSWNVSYEEIGLRASLDDDGEAFHLRQDTVATMPQQGFSFVEVGLIPVKDRNFAALVNGALWATNWGMIKLFGGCVALLMLASCGEKEETAKKPDTPGQKLLDETIAAHGGMEKWHNNGLLQFQWTYHMTDKGAVVDSVQTVDPSSMAVTHEVPGKEITYGMKDGQAWVKPPGTKLTPPVEFWALTPTYFIGIPFVFGDPQVTATKLDEQKDFQGKMYDQVKITYEKGAGDSPDDYYVLLIDPETKVTRGAYYIVTHPLVAPNGPGPEKFITLENLTDVGGLQLAGGHKTYTMEDGKILGQMRYTDVAGVKWVPRGSVNLEIPEGAEKL